MADETDPEQAGDIEPVIDLEALRRYLEEEREDKQRRRAEMDRRAQRAGRSIHASMREGSFVYSSRVAYEVERFNGLGGTQEDAVQALLADGPPESVSEIRAAIARGWRAWHDRQDQ
ncbi:hypothetical protein WNY37_00425 [Henriciella sp. AS95]|uniref:hypothetical protein n=1 Tax=Henriciella sp. AS95 TaxID=3135782 RepID=UPI00317DCC52